MNRYKKLLTNTLSFAIGNFGSKLLQFFLLPFYTHTLTTSEYGLVDIIIQTINIVVPLVSLCIYDAVMRFSMEKSENKQNTLKTGIRIIVMAIIFTSVLTLIIKPLRENDNSLLILLIISLQALRTLFAQYARAIGMITRFSISGIIQTLVLAVSNIILLSMFDYGVKGYLLSIIISDVASIIVFFIKSPILKDLFNGKFDKSLLKKLLLYSIPLVPNSIMWWGINTSNRYFIVFFHGTDMNGLFAVASKIPALLTMLMTIFTQAWQLSAIEEYSTKDKKDYYSKIYNQLESLMFLSCIVIIIFIKPFWKIIGGGYQSAIYYTPALMIGVVFSSLSSFLGSFYLAAKKTKGVLFSTLIAGIAGLVMNSLLIPRFAGLGAGISTFISFLILFIYRLLDTSRFIKLEFSLTKLILNFFCVLISFGVIFINSPIVSIICAIVSTLCCLIVNKNRLLIVIHFIQNFLLRIRNRKT